MTARSYSVLAASIFTVVAILQLVRAISGWPITVGDMELPLWAAGLPALSLLDWRGSDLACPEVEGDRNSGVGHLEHLVLADELGRAGLAKRAAASRMA